MGEERAWVMSWPWAWTWVWVWVGCVGHALAMPVSEEGLAGGQERTWWGGQYVLAMLGAASLLTTVTSLLACVCCKRSRGFKELGSVSSRVAGSTSTLTPGPREEITLFPPPGLSTSTSQINFEPLPDIRPRPGALAQSRQTPDRTLPPYFTPRAPTSPTASTTPADEWFAEPHQNFPRNQLQYVRELGKGWFGQVLEGQAAGVYSDHTKGESPVGTALGWDSTNGRKLSNSTLTPVAVKVLREDATGAEQQYFLQELRPFRDLSHPNVLKVLAYCLEAEPFLILLQLCSKGDLKAVLRSDTSLSEVSLLRMTLDVAAGLAHMHTHNFIHTDLAARNCVVDADNTVKIGDYGYSLNIYKEEYYCAGEVALPLRWCSPETLRCTDTTIETKEVTQAANVWSFGVVMWEVVSRGQLPYTTLDHEEVIQKVIVEQTCQLDPPSDLSLHPGKLYNIMRQCWEEASARPTMAHLHSLLAHLHSAGASGQDAASIGDFEHRWNQLQHRDSRDHSIRLGSGTGADLRFESDFNLSPMARQPLSPSLQNLHGSAEDLDARVSAKFKSALPSWLGVEPGQPIDSLTQEITDAILKLDDYLAGEKSEPSTGETSPEKTGVNFKLGKDSFVSNPPESIAARIGITESGHPSISGTLSEEEEGFTMRLEQGEFTEMVRLKSQSVQDFMRLTVVDDTSDSDTTSQRNSIGFEPLSQEKFSSEGNIKEALRDVKFMGELERLQAEHRYSIITEASRENPSSIEYRYHALNGELRDRETEKINNEEEEEEEEGSKAGSTDRLIAEPQSQNLDHFLGDGISSDTTTEETIKRTESVLTDETDNVTPKPLPASPDCVVSSREPKPATLPDIVAHNGSSTLPQITPSPPPSPSALPLKISQPKEFRFIFGDSESAETSINNLALPSEDSVVFSENIEDENIKECKVIPDQTNSVITPEQSRKDNCVKDSLTHRNSAPVFTLQQKKTSNHLSSMPCKAEQAPVEGWEGAEKEGNEWKGRDMTVGRVCEDLSDVSVPPVSKYESGCAAGSEKSKVRLGGGVTEEEKMSGEHEERKKRLDFGLNEEGECDEKRQDKEVKQRLIFGLNVEEKRANEEYEVKQKLVFGMNEEEKIRSEEESNREVKQRLIFGTSHKEEEENEAEFEEESDRDTKHRLLFNTDRQNKTSDESEHKEKSPTSFVDDTPSYTPEKIITGEEVVIGALDDYSLDLFTAVKSTEDPAGSPGSKITPAEKSCVEITGIEFDLEQWDKFLGKTLSRDNSCSEPVFLDGLEGEVFEGGVVNEALAMDFGLLAGHEESKPELDGLDMSSFACPDFYNVQEEIKGETSTLASSEVVVSRAGLSGKHTDKEGTQRESEELNVNKLLHKPKECLDIFACPDMYSNQEKEELGILMSGEEYSDEKTDLEVRDNAELTKSSEQGDNEPYTTAPSRVMTDLKATLDGSINNTISNANTPSKAFSREEVVTQSPSMSLNTTWSDIDTSGLSTYRREAPIDTSFDQSSDDLSTRTEPIEQVLTDPEKRQESADLTPQDTLDSAVYSNSTNSSCSDKIEKFVENSGENLTPRALGIVIPGESETNINVSSGLGFMPAVSTPAHKTVIIRGEDDLSPSAYKSIWGARDASGITEEDNGDFWEQQMAAWQAAAIQTRQLLQEAAGHGTESGTETSVKEEDESPRSDFSSSKSLSSENLEDEGTYISYNTTDEEEVLGYRPEDISALRAELSLKLETGQMEIEEPSEPEDSPLEDRENVVINYRGMASTLSPIKEESFLEEDDNPSRRASQGAVGEPGDDISFEFEEPDPSEGNETKNETFTITSLPSGVSGLQGTPQGSNTPQGQLATPQESLAIEKTSDSLILEDLDESGPDSIQIYNSGTGQEAEDILVVNTETNEAKILDQGRPRSHLAFILDQEQPAETPPLHPLGFEDTDDVDPESIPSEGCPLPQKPHIPIPDSSQAQETLESDQKSVEFVISNDFTTDESPQGIQVPAYHPYFTSALSSITHPNASLEEAMFEQVEQISLPYDVNYPPPTALEEEDEEEKGSGESQNTSLPCSINSTTNKGEGGKEGLENNQQIASKSQNTSLPYAINYIPKATAEHKKDEKEEDEREEELHSLEDVHQQEIGRNENTQNISEIEDDEDTQPIKLSFLGRLYSDEEKEDHRKGRSGREATLLSDSEDDSPGRKGKYGKAGDCDSLRRMTSAEFLASEKYKVNDNEEIEEQITAEPDSDDSEESNQAQTPSKGATQSPGSQEPRYTPDWESDSDSDGDSSSTSGEFMWRPGEPCQPSPYILDIIEEEPDEDGEREDGECSEDSESGEEEFTPSQWNSDLTPSHSLLKSPQNKSSLKKRVRWKRQRHHRVYEYPPEPRSWEQHAFTEPQYRRSWGSSSSVDYLNLADWELGADEFIADEGEDMEEYVYHKPSRPAPPPPIYSLGPMTYDEAAEGFLVDNGEFFIRSSGSPFTFTRSSFSAADFFPGTGHSSDYDVIFNTPQTPGIPYPPPGKDVEADDEQHSDEEPQDGNQDAEGGGGSLGKLRHTRDKLRLEIPSMSVSGDSATKAEYGEQSNFVLLANRVEPEVSEV